MAGHIELGGRAFAVVNYRAITSLNEHYLHKLLRAIGLDRILPEPDGLPSADALADAVAAGAMSAAEAEGIARQRADDDAAVLLKLEAALADSLRLHELLAGYLLPIGKGEGDWTLELARETAEHLKRLSTPEDRAEVHRLGLALVRDFFQAALDSFKTFESSLDRASARPTPASLSAAH